LKTKKTAKGRGSHKWLVRGKGPELKTTKLREGGQSDQNEIQRGDSRMRWKQKKGHRATNLTRKKKLPLVVKREGDWTKKNQGCSKTRRDG